MLGLPLNSEKVKCVFNRAVVDNTKRVNCVLKRAVMDNAKS